MGRVLKNPILIFTPKIGIPSAHAKYDWAEIRREKEKHLRGDENRGAHKGMN